MGINYTPKNLSDIHIHHPHYLMVELRGQDTYKLKTENRSEKEEPRKKKQQK